MKRRKQSIQDKSKSPMKENKKLKYNMVKDCKFGQMVPIMMANGLKVKYRAREYYCILMVICFKVSFLTVKPMVSQNLFKRKASRTKVIG